MLPSVNERNGSSGIDDDLATLKRDAVRDQAVPRARATYVRVDLVHQSVDVGHVVVDGDGIVVYVGNDGVGVCALDRSVDV